MTKFKEKGSQRISLRALPATTTLAMKYLSKNLSTLELQFGLTDIPRFEKTLKGSALRTHEVAHGNGIKSRRQNFLVVGCGQEWQVSPLVWSSTGWVESGIHHREREKIHKPPRHLPGTLH